MSAGSRELRPKFDVVNMPKNRRFLCPECGIYIAAPIWINGVPRCPLHYLIVDQRNRKVAWRQKVRIG
jgi:hypothetical protein